MPILLISCLVPTNYILELELNITKLFIVCPHIIILLYHYIIILLYYHIIGLKPGRNIRHQFNDSLRTRSQNKFVN